MRNNERVYSTRKMGIYSNMTQDNAKENKKQTATH